MTASERKQKRILENAQKVVNPPAPGDEIHDIQPCVERRTRAAAGHWWLETLPKSVRVLHCDFAIVVESAAWAAANRRYGECSTVELTIRIDGSNPFPWKVVDTVLHEITHAIWWAYGLEDGDVEERVAGTFGRAWTQIWRDNPDLLAWLSGVRERLGGASC